MVKLKNCGPIEYRKRIENKRIYVFGAGRALESVADIYFENKDIDGIIDNNKDLWGKSYNHNGKQVPICSIDYFAKVYAQNKENITLMISTSFYGAEIVEQLDNKPELDGLEVYLQIFIRNTIEEIRPWSFTEGPQLIPKKIHYIWVGGKELPDEFKRNIETWHKYNPDNEIIRWDESNYDWSDSEYAKKAYEKKKWSFFSNYARLDIVNKEGGIYLDTDVEAKRSFDCLLNDKAFFNMGSADRINMGCGFGAAPNMDIVRKIKDAFDIEVSNKAFHQIVHPVIKESGFEIKNQYQKNDGIVLYPSEAMSPLTIEGMNDAYTDKTISVHKETGTWKNDIERFEAERTKKIIERIVDRKEC